MKHSTPRRTLYQVGFTLIELLVVIAIIAILAAILFPVFAQARESARMTACLSNMKQMGLSLRMYSQDYDETYPNIRLVDFASVWKNGLLPYQKNTEIFACPSNPYSKPKGPGKLPNPKDPTNCPDTDARNGDSTGMGNAEGWCAAPNQTMPTSYAMNSAVTTWIPANWDIDWVDKSPLKDARITRPADTIAVAEIAWYTADVHPNWMVAGDGGDCNVNETHKGLYKHRGTYPNGPSPSANFIFWDGHAKNMRWSQTLFPLTQNKWELDPNPDPKNTQLTYGDGQKIDTKNGLCYSLK